MATLADGRFHEVYRQMPGTGSELPGSHKHNHWRVRADGAVDLPPIRIPNDADFDAMAYVHASSEQVAGDGSDVKSDSADFYIDCHELTVAEYITLHDGKSPPDKRSRWSSPDDPVNLDFDKALAIAERQGKRLPTESEFLAACRELEKLTSSNQAQSQPVSNTVAAGHGPRPLSDVMRLTSGVAEWTMTRNPLHLIDAKHVLSAFGTDYRIVRGAASQAALDAPSDASEPEHGDKRIAVPRYAVKPGLGVRFVRSARPHFFAAASPSATD